jgi:hypothetical protein
MFRKCLLMFLASLALVFFSGCYKNVRPPVSYHLGTERIFQKNYQIGQKQEAYVGQPIVKVKDYQVERHSLNNMLASDDFVVSGGIVTISGNKNTGYPIKGEITLGGEIFIVLDIPGPPKSYGVLIRKDGTVHNKVLNNNIVMIYSFKVLPPDLKFTPSNEETINKKAGYLNYELIYSGTDGKSLTVTYREYTGDDLARPAFYQNLVYESSNRRIRFKDIVIEIHEATNEKIVYTVISDGLNKLFTEE